MDALIRQETAADHKQVYALNQSAFGQESEAKLVEILRGSDVFIPALSLVAFEAGEVVGHILFTKIKIRSQDGATHDSLALAPMAVKPGHQKHGIGGQLIKNGLHKARELGYRSVIVLGHEHYYPKFGFVPAVKWNIESPFEVPSNVFMAIELVENGLKNISGVVEYPEAFYTV